MRAGNGEARGRQGGRLMLSVGLCLSSELGVLHRSFHGECTGTDYGPLQRERGAR